MSLCTCGSRKLFHKCCGRFLWQAGEEDKAFPKTPEQLLRSRYSAFALGGYGDYLLATWLPAMTRGISSLALFQVQIQWLDLEILSKSQKGDDANVEFKATYIGKDGGKTVHRENSVFKRINGKWLYVGSEPITT